MEALPPNYVDGMLDFLENFDDKFSVGERGR
jgi:hypothetical protein